MTQRSMDYHETPSGKQLALGVTHELVVVNQALDSLRALAYRDGVAPLFTDEGTPKVRPWDTRDLLICSLAEAYGRLNVLRQPKYRSYLGDELHGKVDRLCYDMAHHGTALARAGWLDAHEKPDVIAEAHFTPDAKKLDAMLGYYQKLALKFGPAPEIDARGAAIAPLMPRVSLEKQ